MERKIILASHGRFASGINSSLQLICGENSQIVTLDCYLSEEFDLAAAVKEIIEENAGFELVVITDLFGGSVNNEFLKYIQNANYYLVAGLNLPFLVEFVTQYFTADSTAELINRTLNSSKEMIKFCNEAIEQAPEEEEF